MKTITSIFSIVLLIGFTPFILSAQIAAPYDILINEFMPAPAAKSGLPNVEYIELYNRSNSLFDLKNYLIVNGSDTTKLPSYKLKSKAYVVIFTSLLDVGKASVSEQ